MLIIPPNAPKAAQAAKTAAEQAGDTADALQGLIKGVKNTKEKYGQHFKDFDALRQDLKGAEGAEKQKIMKQITGVFVSALLAWASSGDEKEALKSDDTIVTNVQEEVEQADIYEERTSERDAMYALEEPDVFFDEENVEETTNGILALTKTKKHCSNRC